MAIIVATGIVAAGFTIVQASRDREKLRQDFLEHSAAVCGDLQRTLAPIKNDTTGLDMVAERLVMAYHLYGLAVLKNSDELVFSSRLVRHLVLGNAREIVRTETTDSISGRFLKADRQHLFRFIGPVHEGSAGGTVMVVFLNANSAQEEILNTWLQNLVRWLVQALLVAFITLLIVRWGILNPLNRLARWMKSARTGKIDHLKQPFRLRFLLPLHHEATRMAEAMSEARASAEEEVRLRAEREAVWTPLRLNAEANRILKNKMLVVVSNREPYMHIHEGRNIRAIVPASGMVTALEPILKACGGLWVASGMGDADRMVVDDHDKIGVPPDNPKYTLRRVWVSPEEERYFYYGFANEGLWPLCHVAHTRPVFRTTDWEYYELVNRKFADVILEEISTEDNPYILVQDYHFALLPAMIKESRPDARVSLFWHIPWPNPESFGICPWQSEILLGMVGADLVGFHTQYHCNNFLSTVNRSLEALVTWETFSVSIGDHTTRVRPFPISISFTTKDGGSPGTGAEEAPELLKNYGINAEIFGVGVDRIDYTKGILERFRGIERFLEKNPSYQGRFTFVQIGAPSRTFLSSYSDLVQNVEKEANRINKKFKASNWKPILLLARHHSHEEILPFYTRAALCMVTSLHDGMNLVAKEFVASRQDRLGVLILSKFAGAAQELTGSLIVNPYDIEEMADAMLTALEMPLSEQKVRMDQMREMVLRHNVYSWAAHLLRGMDGA